MYNTTLSSALTLDAYSEQNHAACPLYCFAVKSVMQIGGMLRTVLLRVVILSVGPCKIGIACYAAHIWHRLKGSFSGFYKKILSKTR
jgi:hypothetical protein